MFRLTQWSSKRECMGKCTGVDSCVGLCSIAPNPWAFNQEALGGHTRVSTLTKKLANIQSSLCTVKDVSAFLDTVQDTRSAFLDTVQDTRSASPLLFHGTGSCQTRKLAHPGDEDDWRYFVLKSINCTPKEMQLSFAMLGTCKLEPEQKSTLHSWVCESHTHTHAKPTFKISFLFFRIYTCWAKTPLFGHSNCSILTVCCYERSFLITLCKLKQRLLLATKGDSEPNLRLRFWHCNSGRWLFEGLCVSNGTAEVWLQHTFSFYQGFKISSYLRRATWTRSSGNCCNGWMEFSCELDYSYLVGSKVFPEQKGESLVSWNPGGCSAV